MVIELPRGMFLRKCLGKIFKKELINELGNDNRNY